jgi:hypothetical protein
MNRLWTGRRAGCAFAVLAALYCGLPVGADDAPGNSIGVNVSSTGFLSLGLFYERAVDWKEAPNGTAFRFGASIPIGAAATGGGFDSVRFDAIAMANPTVQGDVSVGVEAGLFYVHHSYALGTLDSFGLQGLLTPGLELPNGRVGFSMGVDSTLLTHYAHSTIAHDTFEEITDVDGNTIDYGDPDGFRWNTGTRVTFGVGGERRFSNGGRVEADAGLRLSVTDIYRPLQGFAFGALPFYLDVTVFPASF